MKRLFALFLLLFPAWLPAEESAAEAVTAPRPGKAAWSLRITASRYNANAPWRPGELVLSQKEGPPRTALEKPRPLAMPVELKILRTDADNLIGLLHKFNEWVKVAKTNKVKSFVKELGPASKYGPTLTFSVEANQQCTMQIKQDFTPTLIFTESDVADMILLLMKLPELDASIGSTTAAKPKDPTDALFK